MLKKPINSAYILFNYASAALTVSDFQKTQDRRILVPAEPQVMDLFYHIRLFFLDLLFECEVITP